ncbi:DUF429 domain-containing protein [Pseudaeromonas sharmana]|uniref:DUF429 domain-containing protein n=1 Tax=Pseudaeromonas sharmana TaxID=328412 RepID=A0ABV8CLX5_9GAMM
MNVDFLGIGWDVGGWSGSKQAVAIVGWSEGDSELNWFGVSPPFSLSRRRPLSLESLLAPALQGQSCLPNCQRQAIAIDTSLAFPRAFCQLLQGQGGQQSMVPAAEIDNPLAYRDCERWLYREYGKKPLSASFDKLGNNSSLALSLLPALRAQGYRLVPQQQGDATLAIIEGYPALLKQGFRANQPVRPALASRLPPAVQPGEDRYDAALCALMALGFASQNRCPLLPALIAPPPAMKPDEGWIYHFAPES